MATYRIREPSPSSSDEPLGLAQGLVLGHLEEQEQQDVGQGDADRDVEEQHESRADKLMRTRPLRNSSQQCRSRCFGTE